MKVLLLLCSVGLACAGIIAPATTLVRTPSLDSAVIKSDRLGGNFAYSSVEGHAYSAISPVIQNVPTAVGVSYTAHQVPVGVGYAPALLPAAGIAPISHISHIPQYPHIAPIAPISAISPVAPIAAAPIAGPVLAEGTVTGVDSVAVESA